MFLRYTTRRKNGKEHRYYSLVENRRVASGRVVQRHALYLGEINDSQEEAWRKTIEIFQEGQARPRTVALFPEDRMGAVADADIVRIGSANSRCIGPGSGVLAGWQASSGNRWGWIDFGRLACPPAAKARAGIGCCKFWWSIGSWIRAASGGSIGIGLSTARWPICWARTWNWPTSTSSTNVTSGCWSTSGSCSRT